jgi:hypothetical protein
VSGGHSVTQMKNETENPNPPYGQRSSFRKVTLTVPKDFYEKLIKESARRKICREPNQLLSSMLREALIDDLHKLELVTGHYYSRTAGGA